ncbi:hemocyte protein-glutamine gamma-glutamyltransferase-like protein [Dinothrombium tinctorium]|uniref:protein-glutamine gamma-glutamyltransferase n=1 Tax=Dinothrombium tinctorium TaxID=1965070 RepID=A0A3S3PMN9_9ACAR|nr:hemocyte protein-glutamine gamma-glutamyltransferase-like protein [Dinothrombium tinctorium]
MKRRETGPSPNEIFNVELYSRENAKTHRTSAYEILDGRNPPLIIRRGDPFYIGLHFRKPYDAERDKIRMEYMFGPRPQLGKGTLIYLPVTSKREFTKEKSKWDARMHNVEGNVVTVQVHIPANVAVGIWKLRISTKQQGSRNIKSFDVRERIYVLFNPWCKEDAVYLANEEWRREYVLNDVGKIYIGSHSKPKGRKWIYGQFTGTVLPAVMFMMDKTNLDYAARANPVKVVRAVAAMVNSHDDNGLLVGNWSGSYELGTPPWQWTGSSAVLEQYLRTNGEPVKFGQCWVFAGVTTTVCKALGISARTVSNFVSAHDTDDSLTVDKFFDKEGETISDVNSDSIWNFHVWTDCWMSRPDLPPGYGGWQVIDATPQETSDGLYRTGPTSIESVRRGEINFPYDAPFVFSEVNADVVHWQLDERSTLGWKKIKTNKYHVGRKLMTKRSGIDDNSPGGLGDAEDITDLYKFKEGTEEERMAVLNAARIGGLSFLFELPEPGKEDVDFDLKDITGVLIGQPFFIMVEMVNRSPYPRTITLVINTNSVYYTGILARKVKRDRQIYLLQPGQRELVRLRIAPEEYLDKLVDYSMMKIYAVATVKETQQTWSEEDDFLIEKPPIYLGIRGQPVVGQPFGLEIKFTNPLQRYLTDCKYTIEGPGLTRPVQVRIRDIGPQETVVHVEKLVPRKPGPRNIVVVFHSRELHDVIGSKAIEVFG